jgi:hypothetical protein
MNQRSSYVASLSAALLFIPACGGSRADDDIRLGESPVGRSGAEALNANALNANGLALVSLSAGPLAANPLVPGAVDPSVLAALQDPGKGGALARQLLAYTVSCALDVTGSFGFSWTDGAGVEHDETYPGLLGLATYWASGPLDPPGQRWVSACLISRVNYYGVHVSLSSRGSSPALATLSADEIAAYTYEEGAFWGDVFTSPPSAFSCNYAPDVAHSRSAYRDCAAGHVDASGAVVPCGIIQLTGSCDTLCAPLDPTLGYYPECNSPNGPATAAVVTVFLP